MDESDEQVGQQDTRDGRLRGLLGTLLDLAHTRLDLFGTELREELLRLGMVLIAGCVVLLTVTIGLGLLAAALVLALWEDHALAGLGLAGVCFMGIGALALWSMSRVVRAKARPFEASLGELRRDREALRS